MKDCQISNESTKSTIFYEVQQFEGIISGLFSATKTKVAKSFKIYNQSECNTHLLQRLFNLCQSYFKLDSTVTIWTWEFPLLVLIGKPWGNLKGYWDLWKKYIDRTIKTISHSLPSNIPFVMRQHCLTKIMWVIWLSLIFSRPSLTNGIFKLTGFSLSSSLHETQFFLLMCN